MLVDRMGWKDIVVRTREHTSDVVMRLKLSAPFVLALAIFLTAVWVAWFVARLPYEGAEWSPLTGVVLRVDPGGPAAGVLQPGDQIIEIGGAPVQQPHLYEGQQAGAPISFIFFRNGVRQSATVRLVLQPLGMAVLAELPILVALGFWILSVLVLAFKPADSKSRLFFLLCQVVAVTLVCGTVSSSGPYWMGQLFRILLWWLGPLMVHVHLLFPIPTSITFRRRLLGPLYGIAALGSIPHLLFGPAALLAALPLFYPARYVWLAACLILVILLLVQSCYRPVVAEVRKQISMVTLGVCLTLVPFLTLFLLPFAVLQGPLVPPEIAFVMLLFLPCAYGYAIVNYQIFRFERYISRGAGYVLTVSLIAGIYLTLYSLISSLIPSALWRQPLANLVITMILAVAIGALYRQIRIVINHLFYGGWYDYRSAVQQLSETLDSADNRTALGQTFCQGLQAAMQLESAYVLLLDEHGDLVLSAWAAQSPSPSMASTRITSDSPLFQFFLHYHQPISGARVRQNLSDAQLPDTEHSLLSGCHHHKWCALSIQDHLLGLCIVGPKRGGTPLDVDDLEILQVVTRQASIAIQNTELLIELRQRAAESEQLHQELLRAREEECKRVARDLHDQIIQMLVGINYELSEMRSRAESDIVPRIEDLQVQIRGTLDDLRRICSDLRPPALDSLGLVAAVRSRIRQLERTSTFRLTLRVFENVPQRLPENVALCIFRVFQETLVNIQKHAAASQVEVRLVIQTDRILLIVQDDGVGFVVPPHLGTLLAGQHFGLVGMRERLELLHGGLEISSEPGYGTCLKAWVPLPIAGMSSTK